MQSKLFIPALLIGLGSPASAQLPSNLDGKIDTMADFQRELDARCKTGKPPKKNHRGEFYACALLVYEPGERGPGTRAYVVRPIFAVEKNGLNAWASWQDNPLKQVTLEELYGNAAYKDIRSVEADAGVTHIHYPVGLIGREENDACRCLTFSKKDNPFGPYDIADMRMLKRMEQQR
jgi:hypothetical protein